MTRLVEALAGELASRGGTIRTGAAAAEVRAERHRWRVRGEGVDERADLVLVAVPPHRAATLLDGEAAERLAGLRTGSAVVVSLAVRAAALDPSPFGSGLLVPAAAAADLGVRAKAMTHASAKWTWIAEELASMGRSAHAVRLSYGRDGRLPAGDADAMTATAAADLARLVGTAVDLLASEVTWWHGSLVRPVPGHGANVAALDACLGTQPRLGVAGAGLGGNGIAGVVARARREARRILVAADAGGRH